jgi:uncharacterized DUF497 family protein
MAERIEVEFDAEKSERNRLLRGFDFEHAAKLFAGRYIEQEDGRADYHEPRLVAIGPIEGRVHVVVYTWRGGNRRIISARKANAREIRSYQAIAASE